MRCPLCGGEFDPMEAMMDQEWREIIGLLPSFGAHGRLAFEYVEKFGVTPLRMKSAKILRLLEEMSKLFRTGEFAYQKRKYIVSNQIVIEGVKVVVNKHFAQPLENHNYLKKVMISMHEEAQKEESRKKEKAMREREQVLISAGRSGDLEADSGGRELTAQEYLAMVGKRRLREV